MHEKEKVAGVGEKVLGVQEAIALLGAAVAGREQAAEPAPAGARLGIGDDVAECRPRRRGGRRPRAGRAAAASPAPAVSLPSATYARTTPADRVAVGDADAGMAEGEAPGEPSPRDGTRRAGRRSSSSRRARQSASWEEPVQEPARSPRLSPVEPVAEHPEAAPVRVLDAVVVARRLRRPPSATIPARCAPAPRR